MLIATTTVTVTRPDGAGDPYTDPGTPATVGSALPAHVSAPSGSDRRVGGDQEVVDAVLLIDPAPALSRLDLVHDDGTGEDYAVTWTRQRQGLGLDHQVVGLVAVKGGASG